MILKTGIDYIINDLSIFEFIETANEVKEIYEQQKQRNETRY